MDLVNQFEVFLIGLNPTKRSEIKKTRPCVVISPNELNHHLKTVIIVPMTTTRKNYPFRVKCAFKGKHADIALDQLRAVDKSRLIKKIGKIKPTEAETCLQMLQEMFA
ncbi:MAG: type II toxin-antitoxin system PemK/MazF family toxin [Salibacteraceae bacterium]